MSWAQSRRAFVARDHNEVGRADFGEMCAFSYILIY